MGKKIRGFMPFIAISLIPTLLIWLPFFARAESFWNIPLPVSGMATIVSNYDGPLYLVVAKTFYNLEAIKQSFQFNLPTEYYAAHFPLFPILIKIFSFLLGYPYAMLFVTLASSTLALYFFNKFIRQYVKKKEAMWITFVFSIFPARWLIVRSIGSPEPLFLASTIASMFYFQKKKYVKAGIWGALAQLTKSAGILLFISYALYFIIPKFRKFATTKYKRWRNLINTNIYPIFLIPVTLLLVFFFYSVKFNDFFAYFNSGDNIHLLFPPFQIFNYSAPWVGTFWLEEIIYFYLIGALGLMKLIKDKKLVEAWFVGVFFASILFVSHRDVARYALPVVPFLFAAWPKLLSSNEFKVVLAIIAIPIYLFSLAYISQNVMPISNWAPFL